MADESLITTRNLIDTSYGPLRRFIGIFDSMPDELKTFGEGEAARTSRQISLNFLDIEVKEAVEPYHFPIYSIKLNWSNKVKSRWGVFSESYNTIVDQQFTPQQLDPTQEEYVKPVDRPDIKDTLKKRMGLVLTDGLDGRPAKVMLFDGRSKKEEPTACWTVYFVENIEDIGASAKKSVDVAIELLNGKSLADFNRLALANSVIRADTKLIQAISKPQSAPDSFANMMLTSGKFIKDQQGIFHAV